MNYNLKTAWIKALRSNKYKQGQGFLRKNNQYCCLGVLIDLYDKNGWQKSHENKNTYEYQGDTSFLNYKARTNLGLSFGQTMILTRLNDVGKSFDYIAGVIEKQF